MTNSTETITEIIMKIAEREFIYFLCWPQQGKHITKQSQSYKKHENKNNVKNRKQKIKKT